ncbi:hypothetical protein ROS62_17140 [Streptomyces sp. DSM 41972]|uniref:Uncharacterized protein n=1 Tax=Streptomyces althioticus subsp. attaecolombicae TaxID=3075534 RepID=A0ABU3I204_9ACTN|nr:hypothetical protein [Streptomyces sp. DSM 41972]SCD85664.1 pilus assembly protein CpaF [Streptomyces sp. di50b]
MSGMGMTGVAMPPELLDGVRRRLAESGAVPTPARVAQGLWERALVEARAA